jgi:hypothetical protein
MSNRSLLENLPPGDTPPLVCDRCGCAVDAHSVWLEAQTIAKRLWTLNLCGPCYEMLLAALRLELAGAGPGGHVEHGTGAAELGIHAADYGRGGSPLGEDPPAR